MSLSEFCCSLKCADRGLHSFRTGVRVGIQRYIRIVMAGNGRRYQDRHSVIQHDAYGSMPQLVRMEFLDPIGSAEAAEIPVYCIRMNRITAPFGSKNIIRFGDLFEIKRLFVFLEPFRSLPY